MKGLKLLIVVLVSGLLAPSIGLADMSDLNQELIEADAIGADSEAAIIESQELEKELAAEQAEAARMRAELKREKEAAKAKRKRAEKKIRENEKKIADSRAKTDKMHKELVQIEAEQEKLRKKNEKVEAELALVRTDEEKVTAQKRHEEEDLRKMQKDHRRMKVAAKKTAARVSALRSDVKRARIAIAKTYRNMKKDSNEYKKMIAIYRKSLGKANRMLDELEMAIEVDQAYDQKLASMGKLPKGYRTVSGLNRLRIAKVAVNACNVRTYPSTKAEILDKYPSGKEVNMKYHSKSWYTVIHGGEKAFIGKSCFN